MKKQQDDKTEHRAKKAKQLKNWRAKNPEHVKAYLEEWTVKNPEYARTKQREWRIKHPKYEQEYLRKNLARLLLKNCKASAKKRKRNFSLTLSWVEEKLARGTCERTGLPFIMERGTNDSLNCRNPWLPSIDRINSSFGYDKTNCQMVCTIYNLAKMDWTDAEVLKMARAIVEYNKDPLED